MIFLPYRYQSRKRSNHTLPGQEAYGLDLIEAIEKELQKEANACGILVTRSKNNNCFEFRKDWVLIASMIIFEYNLWQIRIRSSFYQYKGEIYCVRRHDCFVNLNQPYELQVRMKDLFDSIRDLKERKTIQDCSTSQIPK